MAVPLLCMCATAPAGASVTARVDPSVEYQTVFGFGTDLAWWAHRVGGWSEPARSEVMKLVFDREQGMGFTVVRYDIGGGENPGCSSGDHLSDRAKIEGFRPTEDGPYDWSAAQQQRWVLQHCRERYGVTDFHANAISPPWWMTVSECVAGAETGATANLKEDYYDDFAEYLTDVTVHFRDEWGVTFSSLSPFNEPRVWWWVKGSPQPGCCYTLQGMDRMVRELGTQLEARGMPTTVCSPDEYAVAGSIESYRSYGDAARSHVGVISSHSYRGSIVDRYAFRDLLLSEGKPGMMSEVCHAGRPEGHTHTGMRCALELAWQITTDLRDMGAGRWILWTPVVDEFYNTNDVWNANDNWGPIHAHFTGPEAEQYWVAKEFYGIAHYSRFIKPGSTIVDSDDPRTLAAYHADSRELVIVAYNESGSAVEYSVEIASLDEGMAAEAATHRTTTTQSVEPGQPIRLQGGAIRDALPPESITTYVIGGVSRTGAVRRRVNDNVTGIGDCQFDYHGTWEYAREETPAAPWMAPLEVDYYKGYCDGPYSKDVHTSSTPGDSYLVRFRGTGIAILGATGEEYGMAAISIDDGPETAIDCYSEQGRDSVALYQSPALADGRHTLRVRVTGERNARAGGALIAADVALITTSGIPAASR